MTAGTRYARHELIPGWQQDRLAAATAVVVGVGALGNEVAKNLALAGIGRLVLCDPDTVHTSNLSRTVLFGPKDGGVPKVVAAAAALRALVPDVVVESRPHRLGSGVGLGELRDAAVVVGCLDSRRARLALLGRCALVEASLVDGGTTAWGGEVRLRLSVDESCYGCSLTAHQRAESDLPWSCADAVTDGPLGASIAATALVAAWVTLAALRVVLGEPPDYRLVRVDGLLGQAGPVAVRRDPDCPHHRPIGLAEPIGVGSDDTVGALLARLSSDVEPLAWHDFRPPGTCQHCGAPYPLAVADGAASRLCDTCRSRLRSPSTRRLRDADPKLALLDLGVAPGEILAALQPEGQYRWLRLDR
jgi:molybdopterin/thiamine biosynthesis adenylyltransferase